MLIWFKKNDTEPVLTYCDIVLYTIKQDNKLFRCYRDNKLIASASSLLSAKKACNYHRRNQLKNK